MQKHFQTLNLQVFPIKEIADIGRELGHSFNYGSYTASYCLCQTI